MNKPPLNFIPIVFTNGRWKASLVKDHKLISQLRDEAGIKFKKWPDDKNEDYDKLLIAAGNHEIGLETI